MGGVLAGDIEQALHLLGVVFAVAFVPALYQPHIASHNNAKANDGVEGAQAHGGCRGIQATQRQDTGLLIEVLHRDGEFWDAVGFGLLKRALKAELLLGWHERSCHPHQKN